ncbi:prolyl-tRNA editing protein [Terrihabitans soli]|uniref:Prolyl-tRNA editing protein n=1 Tax=Terrihabitans soli TaxID=708113 RepID=A0A6S6QQ51_9HYPH|nr:YbaK/EbsC family protein [Terrihabitans soli]BCJ90087.1 prolyl-tRNA editing protein [Terrihabitans soli]
MTQDLPPSAAKVASAAESLGLAIAIRVMTKTTRTAEEAASACGTSVGQIVKSLIFEGKDSGRPLLLLVSGKNRVDEKAVAARLGEKLVRPDAQRVREITGFVIGGIPPLGHAMTLAAYIDPDLLTYDEVWAAAGTPNAVFPVDPNKLKSAIGAEMLPMSA